MKRGLILASIASTLPLLAGMRPAMAASVRYTTVTTTARCTGTVDYPGMVTGTVANVIVPPNNVCILEGATVLRDVFVESNAALGAENSSVGYDVIATRPWEIETGNNGPFSVGHDFIVSGSDLQQGDQGYDICDTSIGHDLRITGTGVQYEIEIGDNGAQSNEFCFTSPSPSDSIGHDLVVSGNTAGKIDVGNNDIGHDLMVTGNKVTAATGDTGDIGVDDNTVGYDATCTGNTPAPNQDGPEDGPNSVGGVNDGC
jgi:hypothetical protein